MYRWQNLPKAAGPQVLGVPLMSDGSMPSAFASASSSSSVQEVGSLSFGGVPRNLDTPRRGPSLGSVYQGVVILVHAVYISAF